MASSVVMRSRTVIAGDRAPLAQPRVDELANLMWLRVHTDEGLTGLGETYFMPKTVEAHVHETVAPKVLGREPLAIDRIAKDLNGYVGFRSSGTEVRGNSAVSVFETDLGIGGREGFPAGLTGFTRSSGSAPFAIVAKCVTPTDRRLARISIARSGQRSSSPVEEALK